MGDDEKNRDTGNEGENERDTGYEGPCVTPPLLGTPEIRVTDGQTDRRLLCL